jgi:ribosomal protein L29
MIRTYSEDYAGWVDDTARAIEEGRFCEIDRLALADEVRDLGEIERRELESAIRVLLIHLLKIRYQPEKQTRSWEASIRVQRKNIATFLASSPSLRPTLPGLIEDAYEKARIEASDETGIDLDAFPETCEFTTSQILASEPA